MVPPSEFVHSFKGPISIPYHFTDEINITFCMIRTFSPSEGARTYPRSGCFLDLTTVCAHIRRWRLVNFYDLPAGVLFEFDLTGGVAA